MEEAETAKEGPKPEGTGQLDRLVAALAALDDDTLRRAIASLSETNRIDVAFQLSLPKAAMHLGDALVPLLRRKVRTVSPPRQLAVAFALSEPVNDDTIAALGPRHDNPSRDDMLDVLPAVIDKHGVPSVTLMLASYAASDAPCQAVFNELLETDDRFELPEPPPLDDDGDDTAIATPVRDDAAQAEKRAQRKAAKEARRAAESQKRDAKAAAEARLREARRAAKKTH